MKNIVLQFQYFAILLSLISAISSCSQLPEYKVTEDGVAIYKVELTKRSSIEELKAISEEVKSDEDLKYCTLIYSIPSVYPHYPNDPWATVNYSFDRSYEDNSTSDYSMIKIMGARSEKDKQQLINIIPEEASFKRVWYHNHPAIEGMVVMDASGYGVELKFYKIPDLIVADGLDYEIPNERIKENQFLHPDLTENLRTNKTYTEFSSDDGTLKYMVDAHGNLVMLLADDKKYIMEPIEIKD